MPLSDTRIRMSVCIEGSSVMLLNVLLFIFHYTVHIYFFYYVNSFDSSFLRSFTIVTSAQWNYKMVNVWDMKIKDGNGVEISLRQVWDIIE